MQIGHSTNLNILKAVSQPLTSSVAGEQAGAAAEASHTDDNSALAAVKSPIPPVQEGPGVILKLQSGGSPVTSAGSLADIVYSKGHKVKAAQDDNADQAAEQYQAALERSKAAPSRLSVDKDGLLVVNTGVVQSNEKVENTPEDFVAFAVHAMRDYAAEQDRLKTIAQQSSHASVTSLIARGLGDVQKLAAKYKLFA